MNKKLRLMLSLILALTMVMGSVASAANMLYYNVTLEKEYTTPMTNESVDELIAEYNNGNEIAKLVNNKLVNYDEYRAAVIEVLQEALDSGKTEEEAIEAVVAAIPSIVEGLEEVELPEEELKVVEVSAIEDINIEFAGEYTLPAEVEVTLSDATVVSVPVVWDETNIDVNVAGTYAVEGTLDLSALENVEATELKATVNVVVAEEVVEQLKVESVSAITANDVTVTFEALEEKLENVSIKVLDSKGEEVAVNELKEIAKGAKSAKFVFEEKYEGKLEGVWKVNGVEFDFADEGIVNKVKAATSTPALATALANEKFENVLPENMDEYLIALNANKSDIKTIKDVQELVIDAGNKAAEADAELDAVKKLIEESKSDFERFNIIKDNFDRVEADYWDVAGASKTEFKAYVKELIDTSGAKPALLGATMKDVQDAIDKVNIEQAYAVVNPLATTSKPSDIAKGKALVQKLVDSDTIKSTTGTKTKKQLLDGIEALEKSLADALEAAETAVTKAETAMANFVAANGEEPKAGDVVPYDTVKGLVKDLAEEDLPEATITAKVADLGTGKSDESPKKAITLLNDETEKLTIGDEALDALAAFVAANGEVPTGHTEYDAVIAEFTDYANEDYTLKNTVSAMRTAIDNLNEETRKLVVYADVITATAAEMRSLLFEFDNAGYTDLSSAAKTEFAEYVVKALAKEDPALADYDAVEAAIFTTGYLDDYQTLINDVNAQADNGISALIPKLAALEIDAFDDLDAEAQADVADAVIENKPVNGYKTIADIVAAMGL